jgi:hypothetical protein
MRYIFADCVLDTALATLHRAGRAIPLRPKVFHLLQYLLEQRAHLVAKDVLCAQVWPGQCISDAALEGCIKLARQAIEAVPSESIFPSRTPGASSAGVGEAALRWPAPGAADGEPVPAALEHAILAKAQGNPFFLEELAQMVVEQGAAGNQGFQLPLTVQGVLAARLDRLPQEAKHLVQCAAVIGTHVPVPLLQAITEIP